jgi:predicted ATPase
LLITRESLQFSTASDHWLDVSTFTQLVEANKPDECATEPLEQAVALYRGPFLDGFTVEDSPVFEEWALLKRQHYALMMSSALQRLSAIYEQLGNYQQAQFYARRQLELEPGNEAAHQALMRTLALDGQRSAALAQFTACRRLLDEELGVEPAETTRRLYQQIRDGKLKAPGTTRGAPQVGDQIPAFLEEQPPSGDTPVFVAREQELTQLDRLLDLALAGQGRAAFVTGEAGSGKTTLVQEFARRAQHDRADLVVASGNCNAYTGIGDPYLPFREILGLLTGDVEAKWAAGAMSRDHAIRLWRNLPVALQALVEVGPDLIETFVPSAALLERLLSYGPWPGMTDWLTHLEKLGERRAVGVPGTPGAQQRDLFEQYSRVLQALAQRGPLLLVVDDLQWADLGSISLLFHLGRHLAGCPILILGAYRPEEVALGREESRHPLEAVIHEIRRDFGDVTINLGQAQGRDFVEALLDSEPNRLGVPFREMLHRQTRGHPLFTIELLRGLQERGDLIQDSEGCWVEGVTLDWQTLPARVEAVIAERLGRLPETLFSALAVASVEGEDFTAEVVARALGTDQRRMVQQLSGELDKRHRLVKARAIERVDSQRVSRYRFRNYLFQKYLYESLDDVERAYLHEDVGNVLEELHGDQATEIAVQLARHFQEAGTVEKAIHYLQLAGDRAKQLSAFGEAISHLTTALALLMTLPDTSERAGKELGLQLALGRVWINSASPRPDAEKVLTRARELCQQLGETSPLCSVLDNLAVIYYVWAKHQQAREMAEEALSWALQTKDPLMEAVCRWHLEAIHFALGDFSTAHGDLEKVIAAYEPQRDHHRFILVNPSDPGTGALAYDACCLWCLGYPDQALQRGLEALALAGAFGHPFSQADVLCYAGCMLHAMRRDAQALKDSAEELARIAREVGYASWAAEGPVYLGWVLVMQGQIEEGIALMRDSLTTRQSIGVRCQATWLQSALAEAQVKAGRLAEGLATLNETLAEVEKTDERFCEAELYRLQGGYLLMQGNESQAEASLHRAIDVARQQEAKAWELRAVMALSRLWHRQGKTAEARQMLGQIYGWFSEGFDTPDLMEAKALLEELQ